MREPVYRRIKLYMEVNLWRRHQTERFMKRCFCLCRKLAAGKENFAGKKKLYYISAEFFDRKIVVKQYDQSRYL